MTARPCLLRCCACKQSALRLACARGVRAKRPRGLGGARLVVCPCHVPQELSTALLGCAHVRHMSVGVQELCARVLDQHWNAGRGCFPGWGLQVGGGTAAGRLAGRWWCSTQACRW